MNLTRQDIDQLIRSFQTVPSETTFSDIADWHRQRFSGQDNEYRICVYLFLVGANIKQHYKPFTYEQHTGWIKEIKELTEVDDNLVAFQRKIYLNYGLKSTVNK